MQNREPSHETLDWTSWLSEPLNKKLSDLDFGRSMEMFKRDNLLAKRRHGTRGKKVANKYALSFAGDRSGAAKHLCQLNLIRILTHFGMDLLFLFGLDQMKK